MALRLPCTRAPSATSSLATGTSGSPAGTPARELLRPGIPRQHAARGWPSGFGADGIDAALYSGTKCYFFDGNQYIRVTRGDTGPGTVDPGYPASIAVWGWPSGFGADGIDAALYCGTKRYFFDGNQYIRVTRGDTGPGTVGPGIPRQHSGLGMAQRLRRRRNRRRPVLRHQVLLLLWQPVHPGHPRGHRPGKLSTGIPASIAVWGWPSGFGTREFILIHFKSLVSITSTVSSFMDTQFSELAALYAGSGIEARRGTTEDLSGDTTGRLFKHST